MSHQAKLDHTWASRNVTLRARGFNAQNCIRWKEHKGNERRLISILTWHDAIRRPTLAIHLPQIPSERVRPFKRSKVAALLVRSLEDDFAHRMDPPERRVKQM